MCQKKAAKTDLIHILCQSHLEGIKEKRWGRTLETEGDGWKEQGRRETLRVEDSDMALGIEEGSEGRM